MKVLKSISVDYYKNIAHAKFKKLSDINIIVGPNNSGKTNILRLIVEIFTSGEYGKSIGFTCEKCSKDIEDINDIIGYSKRIHEDEYFFGIKSQRHRIVLEFDQEFLDKLRLNRLDPNALSCEKAREYSRNNMLTLVGYPENSIMVLEHASVISQYSFWNHLKNHILYIPPERLENYNKMDIGSYIAQKELDTEQFKKWEQFLRAIVDPHLKSYKPTSSKFLRKYMDYIYEAVIFEQGSGVKALACLGADVLFSNADIILIDEPEIGLNPLARQRFMHYLIENLTSSKQIFIATQDATIVNPTIWKEFSNKVSVFMYSPMTNTFVTVDKGYTKDPSTFVGYLPNTTSLKDIHIYVEGPSDVYAIQIMIMKYLRDKFGEKWIQLFNRIGIYHLGGDNWLHFLYLIPEKPYRSLVILDGDKRDTLMERYGQKLGMTLVTGRNYSYIADMRFEIGSREFVLIISPYTPKEKYLPPSLQEKIERQVQINKEIIDKFGTGVDKSLSELFYIYNQMGIVPIFILSKDCIEEYFGKNCKDLGEGYDKKIHTPKLAENNDVPLEFKELFDAIFVDVQSSAKNRKSLVHIY